MRVSNKSPLYMHYHDIIKKIHNPNLMDIEEIIDRFASQNGDKDISIYHSCGFINVKEVNCIAINKKALSQFTGLCKTEIQSLLGRERYRKSKKNIFIKAIGILKILIPNFEVKNWVIMQTPTQSQDKTVIMKLFNTYNFDDGNKYIWILKQYTKQPYIGFIIENIIILTKDIIDDPQIKEFLGHIIDILRNVKRIDEFCKDKIFTTVCNKCKKYINQDLLIQSLKNSGIYGDNYNSHNKYITDEEFIKRFFDKLNVNDEFISPEDEQELITFCTQLCNPEASSDINNLENILSIKHDLSHNDENNQNKSENINDNDDCFNHENDDNGEQLIFLCDKEEIDNFDNFPVNWEFN